MIAILLAAAVAANCVQERGARLCPPVSYAELVKGDVWWPWHVRSACQHDSLILGARGRTDLVVCSDHTIAINPNVKLNAMAQDIFETVEVGLRAPDVKLETKP